MHHWKVLIVAALALVAPGTEAYANVNPQEGFNSHYMQQGGVVRAPFGFVMMCVKLPTACQVQDTNLAGLTAGTRALGVLRSINRQVNSSIRPRMDGPTDSWVVNPISGDCEDYALTKRNALLAAGWPTSALLLTTAKTASGENHAVLVVRTNAGDFVLDNLSDEVREFSTVRYSWLKQQSPNNPNQWRAVIRAS